MNGHKKIKKGLALKDYDLGEIMLIGAIAILIACYGVSILIATIYSL